LDERWFGQDVPRICVDAVEEEGEGCTGRETSASRCRFRWILGVPAGGHTWTLHSNAILNGVEADQDRDQEVVCLPQGLFEGTAS